MLIFAQSQNEVIGFYLFIYLVEKTQDPLRLGMNRLLMRKGILLSDTFSPFLTNSNKAVVRFSIPCFS
jgi:hypothetical protein